MSQAPMQSAGGRGGGRVGDSEEEEEGEDEEEVRMSADALDALLFKENASLAKELSREVGE